MLNISVSNTNTKISAGQFTEVCIPKHMINFQETIRLEALDNGHASPVVQRKKALPTTSPS